MKNKTKTFIWAEKQKGWRPINCPNFDGGRAFTVAHDTIEHLNDNEDFRWEVIAFGVALYGRMNPLNENWRSSLEAGSSDLADFSAEQEYLIPKSSAYANKLVLDPDGENRLQMFINNGILSSDLANRSIVAMFSPFARKLNTTKFQSVSEDIKSWMRLGYKMAERFYGSPRTEIKLFKLVDDLVSENHNAMLPVAGDKLTVTANIEDVSVSLNRF